MAWQCKVWFVHSSSCIQYLGWGCVLCIITLWLPRSAGTLLEGLLLRAGSGAAIPYTSRDFPVPAGCVTEMLNVYDVLPKLDLTVSLLQVLFSQLSRAVKPLLSFVFQLWMKAPENLDLVLLSHLVEILQSSRYTEVFESETWQSGTSASVTWSWNCEVAMKGLVLVGISGFWQWIIPVLLFQAWS